MKYYRAYINTVTNRYICERAATYGRKSTSRINFPIPIISHSRARALFLAPSSDALDAITCAHNHLSTTAPPHRGAVCRRTARPAPS